MTRFRGGTRVTGEGKGYQIMTTYWHDDPATHPPVGTWMWHVHHEVLAEPLTEPLQNRLDYIRDRKPASEIATRLRLISPVAGPLSEPPVQAWAAYNQAWAAYGKAWAAYDKAWADYKLQLEALHSTEHPGCPWDGQTIFPAA